MWGAAVLAEAFQEMLHPTRRLHPLGRLGLVTRSTKWGAVVVSTLLPGPEQTTVGSLWPSAYRLAPAGTARHKVQEFLNSQTKEQSSLTALAQQVLPVHSRPQTIKISGYTHGFFHPSTHTSPHPQSIGLGWMSPMSAKPIAQLAERQLEFLNRSHHHKRAEQVDLQPA